MEKILALDLGTSYLKAALFNRQGALCALAKTPTPISRSPDGGCEMPSERFRQAVREIVSALDRPDPRGRREVVAVTFATQTNTFLLLDRADRPLIPFIIWCDQRARELGGEARKLAQTPGFRSTTGVPSLDSDYMAAKLLWLKRNSPELWQEAGKLCLLSDYLTHWLTGRHVTEAGAAGLTGTVDIRRLAWWSPFCEQLELPPSWLPAIARAGTDLGPLSGSAAAELGVPAACRFVVGCLDQYAGAIGVGNVTPGGVSETTGTVLSTVRCARGFSDHLRENVFQGPSFDPALYYQMLFGSESANLLESYQRQLPDRSPIEELDRLAATAPPGANGLRVRPPALLASAPDAFAGGDRRHTSAHAARAIMETVALALARQVGQLCGAERPRAIRASGGAARSDVWLQIKADALDVPFEATDCAEPTSLGAAILAGMALGWGTAPELAQQWTRVSRLFNPRPEMHKAYSELFAELRGIAGAP